MANRPQRSDAPVAAGVKAFKELKCRTITWVGRTPPKQEKMFEQADAERLQRLGYLTIIDPASVDGVTTIKPPPANDGGGGVGSAEVGDVGDGGPGGSE